MHFRTWDFVIGVDFDIFPFRTLEASLRNSAIRFNAAQDFYTLLYLLFNAVQNSRMLYVHMQFKTVKLCYKNQCRLGYRCLLCVVSAGQTNQTLPLRFNAVQDSRTSLHVPVRSRTFGFCHTSKCSLGYQCSSGLANNATRCDAVQSRRHVLYCNVIQDLNFAASSNAV